MFPRKPTQKQVIGKIGEDCACTYLRNKGYSIVDRNYLKKWGEIDIVAKYKGRFHFVEVKSVSRDLSHMAVSHGTSGEYRAEDNLHPWKLQRLSRVIQSYLLENDVSGETDWQFDVVVVFVDTHKRLSRVQLLEDIVL